MRKEEDIFRGQISLTIEKVKKLQAENKTDFVSANLIDALGGESYEPNSQVVVLEKRKR